VSGLVLTDYPVFRRVTLTGVASVFEIDCGAVPANSLWRVDQIACVLFPTNPLISPPIVTLYDQSNPGPTSIPIQATELAPYPSPYGNVFAGLPSYWADWDAEAGPFTILGGQELAVVFSNVPSGVPVGVRVQYGLFMGSAGAPQPVST
jgi:hypothetical protein